MAALALSTQFENAPSIAILPLWLREHCPGDACQHREVCEQMISLTELHENPTFKRAEVIRENHPIEFGTP